MIESGRVDKVLVVGSDVMSTIIDYTDRNTCVVFGDGAGAVLLDSCMEEGYENFDFDPACLWDRGALPAHESRRKPQAGEP